MSPRTEYLSRHLPIGCGSNGIPMPDYSGFEPSHWVVDFIDTAKHIDLLTEDGCVLIYIGSIRRLYVMLGIVPQEEVVAEEIGYVEGANFGTRNPNAISVVRAARDNLNSITESLMSYADQAAKTFANRHRVDEEGQKILAYEILTKLLLFGFRWSDNGESNGSNIQRYALASLSKMLMYHHAYRKDTRVELYDDYSKYGSLEDYIPSWDADLDPIGRDRRGDNSPWFMQPLGGGDDGVVSPNKRIPQDFRHLPLESFFGLIQTLELPRQYLLMSYFGYLNPGLIQPEYVRRIGTSTAMVAESWHRLYDRMLVGDTPLPRWSLREMLDALRDEGHIRNIVEKQRRNKGELAALIDWLRNNEIYTQDSDVAEFCRMVKEIIGEYKDGRRIILDVVEQELVHRLRDGFGIYIECYPTGAIKRLIRRVILPALNGEGYDPLWADKFRRRHPRQ